jgi:hypothetical protein
VRRDARWADDSRDVDGEGKERARKRKRIRRRLRLLKWVVRRVLGRHMMAFTGTSKIRAMSLV